MGRTKKSGANQPRSGSGANLGFEEKLWAAADKMRGHMDAGEYEHIALGLLFLKYISIRVKDAEKFVEADAT